MRKFKIHCFQIARKKFEAASRSLGGLDCERYIFRDKYKAAFCEVYERVVAVTKPHSFVTVGEDRYIETPYFVFYRIFVVIFEESYWQCCVETEIQNYQ